MMWNVDLTLPLSTLRAADSSDCGITPFSVPNVFTTDDTADGIDSPCEFSARIKNMYDVAGFSSPICNWEICFFFKWEKKRKKNVKNNASHKVKIRAALLLSCIFFVVLVNWFHFTLSNGRSVYFRNGIKCKINKLSKCSLE